MKLTQILILEGRKEDLRKKYSDKFKEYPETLDFILSISDLEDTKFKYADFVLKNTHPNSSTDEIEETIELVKDFHRFQNALDVKDINKYDLDGLRLTIERHKKESKSQSKKIDSSQTDKIYEDNNVLIVRPLTYESSCKYGAGTKWCTTSSGEKSYFESHTSRDQSLYYVILKKFNSDNRFYKIAIHMTPNTEIWYDATDERMSEREKEVFNLGAPKVIQTIREDYEKSFKKKDLRLFNTIFIHTGRLSYDLSGYFLESKHSTEIYFENSEIIPDMPGHATIDVNILIDGEKIDQYLCMVTSKFTSELAEFEITYTGDDIDIEPEFEFDLESKITRYLISRTALNDSDTLNSVFDNICWKITSQILSSMKENKEFMKFLYGGQITWRPDRMNYGYTFKQNKGLIKKLTDYLDSGEKGTKLDFFTKIGILDRKDINGTPYYSKSGENNWHIGSKWRGHYSSFFNSAKLAGILDYEKKGNKFILKKGPNDDVFKSGKLKGI